MPTEPIFNTSTGWRAFSYSAPYFGIPSLYLFQIPLEYTHLSDTKTFYSPTAPSDTTSFSLAYPTQWLPHFRLCAVKVYNSRTKSHRKIKCSTQVVYSK